MDGTFDNEIMHAETKLAECEKKRDEYRARLAEVEVERDKWKRELDEMRFYAKHCRGRIRTVLAKLEEWKERAEKAEARFTAPIVCICGSTRFKQAWIAENARLTGEGQIVLAVGLWGHHERHYPDDETKRQLDDLHKRKIDLCNWVWVLDVDGFIGESTRSEIEYAERLGRPVRYLSHEFPGYEEPTDPLAETEAERDEARRAAMDLSHRLAYAPCVVDEHEILEQERDAARRELEEANEGYRKMHADCSQMLGERDAALDRERVLREAIGNMPSLDHNLIVFEGCEGRDVCVIAPEDLEALHAALEATDVPNPNPPCLDDCAEPVGCDDCDMRETPPPEEKENGDDPT